MGCSHTIIPASEGHLFACPGSRIGSRVRWIRAKFRERYGYVTLPWFIASAYDTVYIAAECLRQTNDEQDADGFRDCLYGISWSGGIGDNYSFDEDGEVVSLGNVVLEILPLAERSAENNGWKVLGTAPTE